MSELDLVTEDNKPTAGFSVVGKKRSIIIDGDSRDPLAATPTERLAAMTPMAPVSGGKYKPVRRTLADAGCTTGETVVGVAETTMFAVGDVVEVVGQATPTAAADAMGTIESIVAGVSITLASTSTTGVSSGDIIEVAENARADDAVLLLAEIDLRDTGGDAVDKGSAGVIDGQAKHSALNYCSSGGICTTRLEYELDQFDFIPATAGA